MAAAAPLSSENERLLQQMRATKDAMQRQFDGLEPRQEHAMAPFMKPIVAEYGSRHPEMKVRHAESVQEMFAALGRERDQLDDGRPIHFITKQQAHHTAWRFQKHEGQVAGICIESVSGSANGFMNTMMASLMESLNPGFPVHAAALISTGAQHQMKGCAAFSAGFLNTFRESPRHFEELSQDVLRKRNGEDVGRLSHAQQEGPILVLGSPEAQYGLLPAHAYKNTQSRKQMDKVMELKGSEAVTKNNETLGQRLERLTGYGNPNDIPGDVSRDLMAKGADKKQISMLTRGIRHLEGGNPV